MNKKILSLVIALVLVLGSVTTVFAGNFDLIHKLDSRKNTAMLELMEDLDVYDQVFEDFANYELEYESKKYALVDIQEKLDAGADGLQEAIEQIDKGEEPSGGLEVVEVSAINSTAIAVEFNQPVQKASAENLNNYYIGIGEGVVSNSSIASNNAARYTAELQEDEKTVIISGVSVNDVIWEDVYTEDVIDTTLSGTFAPLEVNANGDLVVKNKTVTLEARNIRDASGKLASTMWKSFDAKEEIAPEIVDVEYDATSGTEKIVVTFDEPVYIGDAKFYLEDNLVAVADISYPVANDKANVVEIDMSSNVLDYGEYDLDIVGVLDLAGNYVLGNIYTETVTYEKTTTPPTADIIPVVKGIEQIDDGKLLVTFNTAITKGDVVIKDLVNNVDETIAYSSFSTTEDIVDAENTTYVITFADNGTPAAPQKFADVYKTSNEIVRTIKVVDFGTATKDAEKDYEVKNFKLKVDTIAPTAKVVTNAAGVIEVTDADKTPDFVVEFVDQPWLNGVVYGSDFNYDADNDGTNDSFAVIVKATTEEGETLTEIVPVNGTSHAITDNKITLLSSAFTNTSFLDDNNKLIAGDYTVTLPRGIVTDDDASNEQYRGPYQYIGGTLEVTVEQKGSGTSTGESAPQTAQNLVYYNDVENAIYVYFVGADIDPVTAKKASNYNLAGNDLTNKSTFEFSKVADLTALTDITYTGAEVEGALVKIFLEKNTIAKAGQYTFKVSNVATKAAGAKMKPVTIQLADLLDNTAPSMKSIEVKGDAQVEITFTESVKFETGVERNFVVNANGRTYSAESVVMKTGSNEKVLVVHTKEQFGLNATNLSVTLDVDHNDDMFVLDIPGNQAEYQVINK